MCSAPKAPKIPEPEPVVIQQPEQPVVTPPPAPPTPQQPPVPLPMAPMPPMASPMANVQQPAPASPPPVPIAMQQAPPPAMVEGQSQEQPIVKRRKSKRKEIQQASKGASALRIPLDKKLGSVAKGGTGSTGLNIPT